MINVIEGKKSLAIEKFLANIESGWQPWNDRTFSRSLSNLDLAFFFEFLGSLRVGIPGTRMASETVWEQRRVGFAGLLRAGCVSRLADATSIGCVRLLPGKKNPSRTLSRRHSQTVSQHLHERSVQRIRDLGSNDPIV